MKKIFVPAIILALALGAFLWNAFRITQDTASFHYMTDQDTPFEYKHEWRMDHKKYYWWLGNAPSVEAGEAEVAKGIVRAYGYRLPRWWEISRWGEHVPASFRKQVENFGGGH